MVPCVKKEADKHTQSKLERTFSSLLRPASAKRNELHADGLRGCARNERCLIRRLQEN